jgi:hypothetical protein
MAGSAVLNRPIYVGQAYPLLPDYIDLKDPTANSSNSNNQTLEQQRNLMLTLINQKRA